MGSHYIVYWFCFGIHLCHRVGCEVSQPLEKILAIADMANNVGNIIQSARSFKNSRDPVAYIPYQIKPQEHFDTNPSTRSILDLAGKIADCDPQIYGTCCLFPNLCDIHATCSSKKPSLSIESLVTAVPKCSCKPGFIGDGRTRGTGCTNVNECLTGEARCDHYCQDLTPGYSCSCREGYQLMSDGVSCTDINECSRGTHYCSHGCINLQGSYACDCPEGYELKDDGRTCEPINECLLMEEILSYKMQLKSLKTLPPMLSKKAKRVLNTLELCQYPELCQDLDPGYSCGCPQGFRSDPDRPTHCLDINECTEGMMVTSQDSERPYSNTQRRPVCNEVIQGYPSQRCKNLMGAYLCYCSEGFTSTPSASQYETAYTRTFGPLKTFGALALNSFYSEWSEMMGAMSCQDINECEDQEICLSSASRVTNLLSETNTRHGVVVLSELEERKQPVQLSRHPLCVNTVGSYSCQCMNGYKYLKHLGACVDVDECSDPSLHSCDEALGEECVNLLGSYMCRCKKGYQVKEMSMINESHSLLFKRVNDTPVCIDIDECSTKNHSCQYTCTNLPGSYKCNCPAGFELDLKNPGHCKDINECQFSVCPASTLCINLPGSYLCECPTGYTTKQSASQDETALARIMSMLNQEDAQFLNILLEMTSENLNSDFFRQFNPIGVHPGIQRLHQQLLLSNKQHCRDVDECQLLGNLLCPDHSECVNMEGTYSCSCKKGYRQVVTRSTKDINAVLGASATRSSLRSLSKTPPSNLFETPLILRQLQWNREDAGSLRSLYPMVSRGIEGQGHDKVHDRPLSHIQTVPSQDSPFPLSHLKHLMTPIRLEKAKQWHLIEFNQFQLAPWVVLLVTEHFKDTARWPFSCEDINECSQARKTLFYANTLCPFTQPCCINTPGSYICVGRKRVGLRYTCPETRTE